ncbi:hypothetical protein CEUSTIGMA_g7395.t1 [Chlamydomonas eustigma]|uniref:PsbP C-terminal domain-containing protein n=1 Tax=Chlamydomonas eustigma TaxID=1157962 RepID=A0A250XA87_9CHLO|nr:hypothetical protein CEUSTIGMA_g7395.t1 [Chlamydomonas eustigma]|eukprot:GAX79956.1 hypothetical protein CEUSTIGMA_g7395.t1 [Chlamydomonas eustigma]
MSGSLKHRFDIERQMHSISQHQKAAFKTSFRRPQTVCLASPDLSAGSRRHLLLAPVIAGGIGSLLAWSTSALSAEASNAVLEASPSPSTSSSDKFQVLEDPILAYKFQYPVESAKGKPLSMVLAHVPEKYSSAAPLTADARQRIVSELMDLRNYVTVSMTVGPASGVLKDVPETEWRAGDVALTVLIDRSTSRVSSGQRIALYDVEDVYKDDRDGKAYFVYEHLSQGSPTAAQQAKETFRHALAVTATRPGMDGTPYLYTLNLSCRQEMWDELLPVFKKSVESFKLLPTTDSYVPPDKNPWLFF